MTFFYSDVKDLVARYLIENLRSSASSGQGSIITLPLKTIDDRWVSVIVEEKQRGYFLIHDGGKTDSELFCQGVTMSDVVEASNAGIAKKYGVSVEGSILQKACKTEDLAEGILAVAEASAAISVQLVSRLVELEAQEVEARVSETLSLWGEKDFEIKHEWEVKGKYSSHVLDFVALAKKTSMRRTASVDILPRTSPLRRAKEYGFMLLDIRSEPEYREWASLAVIVGAGDWSKPALKIVKEIASGTMEVRPETHGEIETEIRKRLDALTSPSLPLRL